MSLKKKIPPRKYLGMLTDDQERHLMLGWTFDPVEPFFGKLGYPFRDDTHRREIWSKNRAYFMAKTPPGTRCDAWWDYEASEPRRLLSGSYEAHDDILNHGKPGSFATISYPFPVWETEFEYLERLNLLTIEEQKIRADAPQK